MKGLARLRGPAGGQPCAVANYLRNNMALTHSQVFPRRGTWHGVRQPPLPEGHTNIRIQHANYVAERCTPRYYRILTTRTHKPCPY